MALPSILLLASFTGGVFAAGFAGGGFVGDGFVLAKSALPATEVRTISGAVLAVLATAIHWARFHVPITIAVGAGAAVAAVVTGLMALLPGLGEFWTLLVFAGGLALFALAMRWDMSDRTRTTRRADVAFWLHLAAAPLIVHPTFALLGLLGRTDASLDRAGAAVALYAGLAFVALVVDRRALLVSALFYVLYAISALLQAAGALNVSLALTALVVGSALLLLSAFWHKTRGAALAVVPAAVRARVPVL